MNEEKKPTKPTKSPVKVSELYPTLEQAMFNISRERIDIPKNGTLNTDNTVIKYALLDDILNTLKPHLIKNGLFIAHGMSGGEYITYVYSVCSREETTFQISTPMGSDLTPQELASRVTHLRRIHIASLFCLSIETVEERTAPEKKEVPKIVKNDAYTHAITAIGSAKTPQALDFLKDKITNSEKLTNAEKDEIMIQWQEAYDRI